MTAVTTRQCPYCAEEIRAEAVKCRYCGSMLEAGSALTRPWRRSRRHKMVAGVCAGLAEEFGISVTIARLAFVLGTLVSGMGVVIYLVLWVVMPYQPEAELLPPYTDDRRGVAPQRGPRLPGGGG
jgi:phage shock protein PspC (stress-responsive transcriptional regulator)